MGRVTIRRAGAPPVSTESDEVPKSNAERQADLRARMKKRGFVLHAVYVHKDDWSGVKKYLERVNARRDREQGFHNGREAP